MAALGDMLREARMARGLSIEDAERGTRIRLKYLSALEDGNLTALPSLVHARGFLRNYATYLDLDPIQAVEMFDDESQPTRVRIKVARGESPADTAGRRQNNNGNNGRGANTINIQPLSPEPIDTRVRYGSSYIAISLLALPLIIAFYFIYSAYAGRSTELPIPTVVPRPPTVTALSTSTLGTAANAGPGVNAGAFNTPTTYVPATPGGPLVIGTITSTGTLSATNPAGTAIAGQPAAPIPAGSQIVLSVNTTRDAWMRVIVDGVQQYNGTMPKGSSKQWTGKTSVRIRTGRADSVHVVANGSDRGLMGDANTLVVEKEWSNAGDEKVIQK